MESLHLKLSSLQPSPPSKAAPPPMEIKYPPSHASHHHSPRKPKGCGHYAELALAIGEEKKKQLKAATHKCVDTKVSVSRIL